MLPIISINKYLTDMIWAYCANAELLIKCKLLVKLNTNNYKSISYI